MYHIIIEHNVNSMTLFLLTLLSLLVFDITDYNLKLKSSKMNNILKTILFVRNRECILSNSQISILYSSTQWQFSDCQNAVETAGCATQEQSPSNYVGVTVKSNSSAPVSTDIRDESHIISLGLYINNILSVFITFQRLISQCAQSLLLLTPVFNV